MSSWHAWEIIKTIEPWAIKKKFYPSSFKLQMRIVNMIPEFQGNRPFFQPLHMKDMMDAKNIN
jgi:hypothetical protein